MGRNLDFHRLTLRFNDRLLETDYRVHANKIQTQNLFAGLYPSYPIWLAVIGVILAVGMEEMYMLSAVIACTIFPIYGIMIYLAKKDLVGNAIGPMAALSNVISGNLTLFLASYFPDGLDFMLPAIVFNVLFALYQMKLSLIQSLFGPTTYLVVFIIYLNVFSGTDYVHKLVYTFLTILTAVFVVLASYLQEHSSRKLFAKNQLIFDQAKDLEIAHASLHEKNTELVDSIRYAKRLQTAILPATAAFKSALPQSFVLYKPKDIVAGDFYWMSKVGETVLFAAADCTGHGVPGAMVSVICNSGLNRSVNEYKLLDPGAILNRTRDLVIQEFEKSDEDVLDGMDIALCALKGRNLQFAGANNPLWIVRKGELIEIKGNKQPIGKYLNRKSFTTHELLLEQGDLIYIFSDGFADQFGGEHGKKLKARVFKELLVEHSSKTMDQQQAALDHAFEDWKGSIEQIDDVCVIGVLIE